MFIRFTTESDGSVFGCSAIGKRNRVRITDGPATVTWSSEIPVPFLVLRLEKGDEAKSDTFLYVSTHRFWECFGNTGKTKGRYFLFSQIGLRLLLRVAAAVLIDALGKGVDAYDCRLTAVSRSCRDPQKEPSETTLTYGMNNAARPRVGQSCTLPK